MKIAFVIPSLHAGGAERQLIALSRGLAARGHDVSVLVFATGGALEHDLEGSGVKLVDLRKRGRLGLPATLYKLISHVRRMRPDVLHGYMPVANMLCCLAAPLVRPVRVVLGVRASDMDLSNYGAISRLSYGLEARLSFLAHGTIANSEAGMRVARGRGVRTRTMSVVRNGIDTGRFVRDEAAGALLRAQWGVGEDDVLVGVSARLDVMKDHPTFLRAAALASRDRGDLRFVCVGGGPEEYAASLRSTGSELGLDGRLVWAGQADDMRAAYSALDVACSSSRFGEGFSNSVAEAMACGAPCVVTDVGDSAYLVGDTGVVVAPGDVDGLAKGIVRTASVRDGGGQPGDRPGDRARERIVTQFSLDRLVENTENVLTGIVRG